MASLGVALITGASQGIGRAIALRLAKNGYNVALADIHSKQNQLKAVEAEIARSGRQTCIIQADVKHEAEVKDMIGQAVQDLGSLDVMVANSGIHHVEYMVDTSVEKWDEIFAVNARGVFLCYKYAAQQMISQGRGGRIVGAGSIAGKQGFYESSAYSASKFAVRGLTQAAAKELAPHGITVNAYAPGFVATQMVDNFFKGDQAAAAAHMATYPIKRFCRPDEVAALVSFLVSKDAAYITGQAVSINGGLFFD